MKNLETFEAAAELIEVDPNALPIGTGIPERFQKATVAAYKLFVISEAAWKTEGKEIDWDDDDQYKYNPWFDMEGSSGSPSGFSCFDCVRVFVLSLVGSRLVFPTYKTAKYVAETHLELYRDLMVK